MKRATWTLTSGHSRWPDWLGAYGVLLGFLLYYYRAVVQIGKFWQTYVAIAEGHAFAPFQYRILVPILATRLASLGLLSLVHVIWCLDLISLFGGFALLLYVAQRHLPRYSATVWALYIAYWGYGMVLHPKPETFLTFAGVNFGALVLLSEWRRPVEKTAVVIIAMILSLSRSDVLAALAVPYAMRWWRDKRGHDAATFMFMLVVAAFSTTLLARVYPRPYVPNATIGQIVYSDLVQHNIRRFGFVTVSLFLAPAMIAMGEGWKNACWSELLRDDVNLLALACLAELAFCAVLGHLAEAHLMLPFAGVLSLVATRAVIGAPEPTEPQVNATRS